MTNQGRVGFLVLIIAIGHLESVNGGVFIPILQQEQQINPVDGSYKYSYATANGIMVVEDGKLKNAGTPEEAQAVEGVYTYLNSADGTLVNVRYFADEGGFRAVPNVIYRPAVPRAGGSGPAEAIFQNVDSLRQALTQR